MKRYIKIIMIIMMVVMIGIKVEGKTEYRKVPEIANKHIKKYKEYERYIVSEISKYGYENGQIVNDKDYITGGLLNKEEFEISRSNEKKETYLFNGLEYFTMTKEGNKIITIDPREEEYIGRKAENEASGIRVTNYVDSGVKLRGRGSIVDPWEFIDRYYVEFIYEDEKITISPSTVMVPEEGIVRVEVEPSVAYMYKSNDCGAEYKDGKLELKNISRDIKCRVDSADRIYELRVDSNGGILEDTEGWQISADKKSGSKAIVYNEKIGQLPNVSKEGYNFIGWYTEINGGSEVTSNTIGREDIRLYARWEAKEYTLTYNNNGGSGCTSKTGRYDSAWGNLCTATRSGYTFNGWYTQISGGSEVTSSTIVKGNITVYARWTPKTYTVTFDCNGGSKPSGTLGTQTVTYGQSYTLPSDVCTRSGYTQNGWRDQNNKLWTTSNTNNWTWAYDYNVTLKAQWTAKIYTVKYVCGTGGGTAPANQTVSYGSSITIQSGAGGCSKTGHVFSNWTSPGLNGSGTSNWKGWSGTWSYDNGQYGIASNVLTLTATYTQNSIIPSCTLTADSNGVKWKTKTNATSYGLIKSTTVTYNSLDTVALSAGTFYGYVKSSTGDTASCNLTLTNATASYSCVGSNAKKTGVCTCICEKPGGNTSSTVTCSATASCESVCDNAYSGNTSCIRISYSGGSTCSLGEHCNGGSSIYTCPNNGCYGNDSKCHLYNVSSCPSGYSVSATNYKCSSGTLVGSYCY